MAATEDSLRKALAEKQSSVDTQGNTIRLLKEAKSSKMEIDAAVAALSALKLEKASIEKQLQAAISGASGDGSLTREAFRQAKFSCVFSAKPEEGTKNRAKFDKETDI